MIDEVIFAAQEAGEEILRISQGKGGLSIEIKDDLSPVTIADTRSNEILKKSLYKVLPIPIFSEESLIPYSERSSWERFWLIDPLDGTKEFINNFDEYAINIALIKNGNVELGLIYNPPTHTSWYAIKGEGAYKLSGDRKQTLTQRKTDKIISLSSRFHESEQYLKFLEINNIPNTIQVGASLKFCYLSEGQASLYPRFVGSSEWDIAAGKIIVEESGGWMLDLVTNAPPAFNKISHRNNFFMAGNPGIDISSFKLPG